jgi:hypothetical protein
VGKPLIDYSDDELRDKLRGMEHISFAYNDVVAEMDRRASNRQSRASLILSVVSVVIAVAAIIVSALR